MKANRYVLRIALLTAAVTLLLFSCRKESDPPEYDYCVSLDHLTTYNTAYISTLLDNVSGEWPEIADLKALMTTDVKLYKLVYRTTVNGNQVNASGLVCVPVNAGEYPVLCFHNGTNTVNAFAPTNFPLDPSFQMIEFVASMGYIIVIPDYPGFGASAQLDHPYLITEPTVQSVVDMLYAVKEISLYEFPGVSALNEYYLLGYSQGGWAAMNMHRALELDYADDFNLAGSACGAGPYNLRLLLDEMLGSSTYNMPVYIGYIIHAYSSYDQFTNPVTEILNEPYASALDGLYDGTKTSGQINSQLTNSISDLINADFLSGYDSDPKYASVRDALARNSITAWNSKVPLLMIHGGSDTQVDPITTGDMHAAMLQAGTDPSLCIKEILPGLDHGDGVIPALLKGLFFIGALRK